MVYKRYIYRNGKKFGPYYYESYRDKHGIARTRYAKHKVSGKRERAVTPSSSHHPKRKGFKAHPLILILLGAMLLIILGIIFLNYQVQTGESGVEQKEFTFKGLAKGVYSFITGFTAEDGPAEESESEPESEEPAPEPEPSEEEIIEEPSEEEPVEEEIEEEIVEEPLEEPEEIEANETEEPEENITEIEESENVTEIEENITEIEENVTEEQEPEEPEGVFPLNQTNITEFNITEQNFTITNETLINETLENATIINETMTNITANISVLETTQQYGAVLGIPVRWEKKVRILVEGESSAKGLKVDLPNLAKNISVKKLTEKGEEDVNAYIVGGENETEETEIHENETTIEESSPLNVVFDFFLGLIRGVMTGRVVETVDETNISVEINEEIKDQEQVVVEYYTDAPYSIENEFDNGKEVRIIGPEELHYENVLVFTNLSEDLNVKNKGRVTIYWEESNAYIIPESVEDLNEDGIYDYISWIVPHLSNQTFTIIVITKADHLDENKTFISDVFDEVKELDDVWSEEIPATHYLRVTFEINLTSENDITIYPRTISGEPRIEIYGVNGSEIIAEFESLIDNEYNKVYLTGLNASQDTFDLRVLDGSIEIDHIIDPAEEYFFEDCADISEWNIVGVWAATAGWCSSLSGNDATMDSVIIDLSASNITYANLSFDYSNIGLDEGVDYLKVYVKNSTSDYIEIFSTAVSSPLSADINISPYILLDNSVQIQGKCKAGGRETCKWDNVNITAYTEEILAPIWSANFTNSTGAGQAILHSVNWSDDVALSGYIFSFDNGTGTLVNDSWVAMIGGQNWSNVTRGVNYSVGVTIQWKIYANDSGNAWNSTDTFSYITTDVTPPTTNLVSPSDGLMDSDGSVELVCNSTDNSQVENISLYTNTTGTWHLNRTAYNGEYDDATNLVLHYHLNNDSNYGENETLAHDFSTSGYDGLINGGAAFVDGKFGKARDLGGDGSGDYIDTGETFSNQVSGTILMWINFDGFSGSLDFALLNNYDGGGASIGEFLFYLNDDATLNVYHSAGSFSTSYSGYENAWHLVSLTWGGNVANLSIDGVYKATDGISGGWFGHTADVWIGRDHDSGIDREFDGTIDEVAVYSRTFSQAELLSTYNYDKTFYNASFDVNNIGDGNYVWNCEAYDNAGQSDFADSNFTFKVNFLPSVTLISPSTGSTDYDGDITFECNATDSVGLANISLYTNTTGTWHRNQTYDESEELQLDYTYDVADVHVKYTSDSTIQDELQMKWDISNIPKNSTITDAELCLYIDLAAIDGNDLDANFSRIDNQTWDEDIDTTGYNALIENNITNTYTWSSGTATTWSCINITNALKIDYDLNNNYTSFRIEDLDYAFSSADTVYDTTQLFFGQIVVDGAYNRIKFASRESATVANRPYINITYSFSNETSAKFNVNDLSGGGYIWNCEAYDTDSTLDWGDSNWTFSVDALDPTADFGTNPVANYNDTDASITFDLKCFDNGGVDVLQLWGNWTGTWHANQTNSSPVNNTYWNVSVSGIPDGDGFIWGVYCNDSVGNDDWSNSNRTFSVDVCELNQISSSTTLTSGGCAYYNITADNIVFDCGSNTIYGENSATYWGIEASNRDNVTIKNCIMEKYAKTILFNNTHNSNISSNTLYNNSHVSTDITAYGIYLKNSNNTNMEYNNITKLWSNTTGLGDCYSVELYAVYIDTCENLTYDSNTIRDINGQYSANVGEGGCTPGYVWAGTGVYVDNNGNSSNLDFLNSNFTDIYWYGLVMLDGENVFINDSSFLDIDIYSVYIVGSDGNINAYRNHINYSGAIGFYVINALSDKLVINNNDFHHGSAKGLNINQEVTNGASIIGNRFSNFSDDFIYVGSTHSNISNNVLENSSSAASGDAGIRLVFSEGSVVENNTIFNVGGSGGYGILVSLSTGANNFTYNNITNSSYGIYFSVSDNQEIWHTTINGSGVDDVYLVISDNIKLYNVSFNKSNVGFGGGGESAQIYYNYRTNVTDQNIDAVESAKVNISDAHGTAIATNDQTDADGLTVGRWVMEYNQTAAAAYVVGCVGSGVGINCSTPHNVTASKEGYATNSTNITIDENKVGNVIIQTPKILSYIPINDNFSIAEPDNETFSIITYLNATPITIKWFINDTEQVDSENSTQYIWVGNYSQEGVYEVKVNISNEIGGDEQVWVMTVNDTNTSVNLDLLYPSGNINASQNSFFNVTLNVTCVGIVNCSTINVGLLYNNILVNATTGAAPFYTNASSNPQTTDSLNISDTQTIIFWVNATGSVDDVYEFVAYANTTSYPSVSNITAPWNVTITSQAFSVAIDISANLSNPIIWDLSSLPATNQTAPGDNESQANQSLYYVNISVTGGNADLYMKASGNLETIGGDVLGLGNETFRNSTNGESWVSMFILTSDYADNKIGASLNDGDIVYLNYYISAPSAQAAGNYNNTLSFKAVKTGESP